MIATLNWSRRLWNRFCSATAWVTVASELSATVVLYSGPWRTLTVVMFQALESGGGGVATAAASTLIVVTLLPIALLYRLVRRYELS